MSYSTPLRKRKLLAFNMRFRARQLADGTSMTVYIANFGRGNWAWPECLQTGSLAVMDDVRVHPFWLSNDREGYIKEAQKLLRLSSGGPVPTPVASRWFNLNTILATTEGDLWIHREKHELWWTNSIKADSQFIDDPNPTSGPARIYLYHKKCSAWSDRNGKGALLGWDGLHPKAKEFLFTEGTFQKLSDDNAAYAKALIAGEDLSAWHARPDWKAKAESAKRASVTYFDSRRKTIVRMAMTAMGTIAQSGDISVVVKKDKALGFRDQFELEKYIDELMTAQDGACALTGLRMSLDGDDGDTELACSLDRIDSNAHYERGNLQIVCKFANRWKGASDNEKFLSLIAKIRALS